MNFEGIIDRALFDGYATMNLNIIDVIICILCTLVISCYVFLVYKRIRKKSFYNRSFNLSLIILSIIVSAIILTIQSNIVVSLGMVGALSIVRFRTAVKDPLDLVFLFWSISVGIICGAGFALIAIVASIAVTIIIIIFAYLPDSKDTMVLVVNASTYTDEVQIMKVIEQNCSYHRVRAKNITKESLNMAVEVKVKKQEQLMSSLIDMKNVESASLVSNDGDSTF